MADQEAKRKVLDYLMGLEGKGVATIIEIGKSTGMKRKDCSAVIRELEEEGKVTPGGVMAGVAGYKAVK